MRLASLASWLLILAAAAALTGCGGAPVAPAEQASPSGDAAGVIDWMDDYESAVARAQEDGKPLMVDVGAEWCSSCKRLDETVFARADVAAAAEAFVPVRVDGDARRDLVADFDVTGYPTVIFLAPDGDELGRVRGAVPYQIMLDEMAKAAPSAP